MQILIDVGKKIKKEKSLHITFKYNNDILDVVRNTPRRYYNGVEKLWEVGIESLSQIVNSVKTEINIIFEYQGENFKQQENLCVHIEDIKFRTVPFDYQKDGIKFGLEHPMFLLGDQQGLGKTLQAINIAIQRKTEKNKCLILCGVNGLKFNWKNEIKKHSYETGWILGESKKNSGNKQKIADLNNLNLIDSYFIITNIESLRDSDIVTKLKAYCDNGIIDMIIFDEIHKSKNPTSQQSKGLFKLNPKYKMGLSGTPLMNSPLDLFAVLKWLEAEKCNWTQFKRYYCIFGGWGGYEVLGYRNLDKLQEKLNTIQLRRSKTDVLDLPEKIYIDEIVEMTGKQSILYKEIEQETLYNIAEISMSPDPLSLLTRLRQVTSNPNILTSEEVPNAKMERLEELMEEIVANNEKAIIFSNWTKVTDLVFEKLKKYNPAIITGQITNRQEQELKFMNDPKCKLIIGTIGAMGTGLTLTAANTVIFMDEPWNRANKEQAEDRAHRIGINGSVNIVTLICKNTIDEKVNTLIHKKGMISDCIVDKKLSPNELLTKLLY